MTSQRVVVEADGGSRGNPGPAGYGAVVKDADTGAVIAEEGTAIGRATNNVAEYSGLIAGLRMALEHAPGAEVEVRMDSKLVVEQMSGRWKVKHPDMRPLWQEATMLAPMGTTYTWIPRERNQHADRLANEALDGKRSGVTVAGGTPLEDPPADSVIEEVEEHKPPARGWGGTGTPTTFVVVRHGVTAHTSSKKFSGGLGGDNPPLSDEGRDQIRAVADWLAPMAERIDAVVASPVRRTRESADLIGERLGIAVVEEAGFAEMEFGHWDGLTFGEVGERHGDELASWLGSMDAAPVGGESFRTVQKRVLAGLTRQLAAHPGKTVVVVSHVTPIKTLVAHALEAPLEAVFRMELSPASVTVLSYFPDGRASMRLYNALPPARDAFAIGFLVVPDATLVEEVALATVSKPPSRKAVSREAVELTRSRGRSLVPRSRHLDHRQDVRQTSLTTTSSWVPFTVGSPTSTVQPRSVSTRARAAGVRGSRPSSSRARTRRPLVALLKWLTTLRRPSASWSTRTVATRRARSGVGRQNAAYVLERRSTSRPVPSASTTAGPSASRQRAATAPSPGSEASPESR